MWKEETFIIFSQRKIENEITQARQELLDRNF